MAKSTFGWVSVFGVFLSVTAGFAASAGGDEGYSSVKVSFMRETAEKAPFAAKAAELLKRGLQERGCQLTDSGSDLGNACEIVLDVSPGIGTEGFRISKEKGAVRISGNDGRGLIYGVGKFLRGSTFADCPKGFRPSEWQGVSVSKRSVRGIYFATHFHNFYHDAPIEKVERYTEELSLWGCNTLGVWFDMHHYNGINDPAAKEMIGRLHRILKAANGVGIDGCLLFLANEGYANSPTALRADWTSGHDGYFKNPGGHYHVEICPSKTGGMDFLLNERRDMLKAFADLTVPYVCLWPYDQGGCTCAKCAPWGCNGFIRTADACSALVKEVMPKTKIILSTWYFDHFVKGEWEGLDAAFKTGHPAFADFLMAGDNCDTFPDYPLTRGVPGGLPLLDFPEISMYRMNPWGGYGANPLPDHLQRIWRESGARLAGGFPYSEGIFEDLNKAICLQFYWGDVDARKTVAEYASGIASPRLAEKLSDAIYRLEAQHGHGLTAVSEWAKALPPESAVPIFRVSAEKLKGADETLKRFEDIESEMQPEARKSWRWRLLLLRAGIDAELARHGGRMTDKLDSLLSEVTAIMDLENAAVSVRPQNVSAIRQRLKGEK